MSNRSMEFTKARLEKLAPEEKPYIVWDEGYNRGGSLGCRVMPGGAKAIIVQFNVWKDGKRTTSKPKITTVDAMLSIEELRRQASDLVRAAQDAKMTPAEQEEAEREAKRQAELRAGNQTIRAIADLGAAYLEHRKVNKPFRGAATRRQHEITIERAARHWGERPITELTRLDGTRLMNAIIEDAIAASEKRVSGRGKARVGGRVVSGKGYHPGHQVAATSKSNIRRMMKFAADELGLPVRTDIVDGWSPQTNRPKRAAMTAEERKAFFEALEAWERDQVNRPGPGRVTGPDTADILRLAYLAGGRGGEWKAARVGQIKNLDNDPLGDNPPTWEFELGDRKQGTEHIQVLHPDAVAILRRIRGRRLERGWGWAKDDFVFPHSKAQAPNERHRETVYDAFRSVLEMSGLNADKSYGETLSPHRVVRASRITQLLEEDGWNVEEVADHLGMTEATIRKHYHVPHGRLARQQQLLQKTAGF